MLSDKPCEIQQVGNRVKVLFEGRREFIELDLADPDQHAQYEHYMSIIWERR